MFRKMESVIATRGGSEIYYFLISFNKVFLSSFLLDLFSQNQAALLVSCYKLCSEQ